ncbi:hypothetical protein ACWEK5_50920 [Rhodococcus koreensis]
MTSLSAPNVLARLLGLGTPGLVAGEAHVHIRLPGGEFEEIPTSSRNGCRHADTGSTTTRTVPQRSATVRDESARVRRPDLTAEDGAFVSAPPAARRPSRTRTIRRHRTPIAPHGNRSTSPPTGPPSGGGKTGLMTGHRRWTSLPPHRTPTPPSAEDMYDDLRERLPAELRDQPDDQIPRLWAAWSEARSGYDAGHLIRTFQLAPALAHRLVDLAHERQS